MSAHLAIDLGASSGRAIVGVLDGNPLKLALEEVHRFEHQPCPTPAGPVWDLTGIWLNILEGLRKANAWCAASGIELASVGVDTWGVDWALVGKSGELIGLPHCYRDPQNVAALERVVKQVGGKEALYARNGIQLMPINSLFQVAARLAVEPGLFGAAERLMFIPDLFHFWLSGEMTTERTIASTSAMLDLKTGDWDRELMDQLGVPNRLLGPLVDAGTVLGKLTDEVCTSAGISHRVQVIAPGGHDTSAAVAAVPVIDKAESWAYLSSGTWSLLGAELDHSFASPESCAAPFTNERGFGGTVRFLKNIGGLWLVQELRRELLEKGETISFAEMVDQARGVTPFQTLIDPNESRFAAPGKMAERIRRFAAETNQPEPQSVGELVRCCLESLALSYRHTVDLLESVLSTKIDVLHVVGGGTQNQFLNELTAATLERPVICGPVEATAIGNLLTQAIGAGNLSGLPELREVVARSFELKYFGDHNRDDDAGGPPIISIPPEVFSRYQDLVAGV